MEARQKKVLKISLIILLIGGAIFGGYKLFKYIQSKSGDERKNSRRITFKKNR